MTFYDYREHGPIYVLTGYLFGILNFSGDAARHPYSKVSDLYFVEVEIVDVSVSIRFTLPCIQKK